MSRFLVPANLAFTIKNTGTIPRRLRYHRAQFLAVSQPGTKLVVKNEELTPSTPPCQTGRIDCFLPKATGWLQLPE